MRLWAILGLLVVLLATRAHGQRVDMEDNEFAEFEEFDEEDVPADQEAHRGDSKAQPAQQSDEDEEVKVEEEGEEEFDHFQDEEEFEGLDQEKQPRPKSSDRPDLKIAKVPLHLRSNWESFYVEFVMIAGLLVYFSNFVAGRNKNHRLAMAWYNSHRKLLEENFSLVGDDGKQEIEQTGPCKDSESVYTLWCSGRVCVEGMLVELRFLKRQDLVGVLSMLARPASDQIIVKVTMSPTSMDNFVMCIANKAGAKMMKNMADLCTYCPEKKKPEKYGLPSGFTVMTEMGEVVNAMLDTKVMSVIHKYEDCIDYIHISDQYSGPRIQEDTQPTKLPEVKKVLLFGFSVPGKGHVTPEVMESMKPLLQLVFYCIEKVRRFKLSKEAKLKSDKNRLKVEEEFLKTTHTQRQEAAQQKREERRRVEKERIMNEEDPEKQRKWESAAPAELVLEHAAEREESAPVEGPEPPGSNRVEADPGSESASRAPRRRRRRVPVSIAQQIITGQRNLADRIDRLTEALTPISEYYRLKLELPRQQTAP